MMSVAAANRVIRWPIGDTVIGVAVVAAVQSYTPMLWPGTRGDEVEWLIDVSSVVSLRKLTERAGD